MPITIKTLPNDTIKITIDEFIFTYRPNEHKDYIIHVSYRGEASFYLGRNDWNDYIRAYREAAFVLKKLKAIIKVLDLNTPIHHRWSETHFNAWMNALNNLT